MTQTYVFTDGSTFNNQKNKNQKTVGGIGVYFGDNDPRNVSEPYCDKIVTNNRTELTAVIKAIKNHVSNTNKEKQKLIIYSDSQYVIKSMTEWIHKWKKNNWKTANGKNVLNQDLITYLDDLISGSSSWLEIEFQHVRAHKKEPAAGSEEYRLWYGNMMADKFATDGSRKTK